MSELNYKDNYLSLVQALQMGGTAGLEALKSSRGARGLGRRLDPNRYVSDEEAEESSLSKRLLDKMDSVQKENESMLAQLADVDVKQDPVTGDLKPYMRDPNMKTSGDIAKFIAEFEKFSPKAYDDYGRLSIGYGTKASSPDQTITKEEALAAMNKEIEKARNIVLKAKKEHGYDWSQNQIDALTSFTYNAGGTNFKRLLTGDEGGMRGDEEIALMITEYNTAGGKVLPGLTKRREAELKLFEEGYS